MPVPPRQTPHLILKAHTHCATLQLIAALLLTLMLLWHISTVSLVEKYQMPGWWVRAFLARHASAWQVGLWSVVGVLVSVEWVRKIGWEWEGEG